MGSTGVVTDQTDPPIVRVRNFRKRFGSVQAVDGVELEFRRGEIYGLIGPDGAGKSSLMKAVAGVLAYDEGTVEVFGVRVDSERAAEQVKSRIGFMPQGLGQNLYGNLSVEENIDFFARLRLVPKKELVGRKERLLEMTRLAPFRDRPMKQLSGGMKQKLGLICALIHEPKLLILDEPTTGVDPVSRRDFWAILAQLLRERGITALVSTAYMDEASRFHRVSLLFEGRVLAQGDPEEIQRLSPSSVVSLLAQPQVEARRRLAQAFSRVEAFGPSLRVIVENMGPSAAERAVRRVLTGVDVRELQSALPDLEDAFIGLLHDEGLIPDGEAAGFENGKAEPAKRQDGECAIEAEGLIRDFGDFRAVDRVDFRVRYGEIFGLLGANGAGKTTAIKMLTGILKPTGGIGRVAGADLRKAAQAVKEKIGYMSQAFSLYLDLTVAENIRLYAGIYGLSKEETEERLDWVLQMAGLIGRESSRAAALPMGMRQRLALGCALVHSPQILFLDEPTSGVDPIGRRRFWDILFELSRKDGVAILVTTHYMSEAEHCDRLALMYAGRVVADGSPSEMKRSVAAQAGTLLEITASQPLRAMNALENAGFEGVGLFGKRIHLLALDPQSARELVRQELVRADIEVLEIGEQPLTMEDVFVYHVLGLERKARAA